MKNLKDLIKEGQSADRRSKARAETESLGRVRGGDAFLVAGGQVFGRCPRIVRLRQEGYQVGLSDDRANMFKAGWLNETGIIEDLQAAGCRILSLKEIADFADADLVVDSQDKETLKFSLPGGLEVFGSPDIVFEDPEGGLRGVEAKRVSSLWTAKKVHYDLIPNSNHLVQTGFYSFYLEIPFDLVYRSDVDWHVSTGPKWLKDKFPPGCYDVEFRFDRSGKGSPLKILPFDRVYSTDWVDGKLIYQTEGRDAISTVVSQQDLLSSAKMSASLRESDSLPARPSERSVDGSESYSACQYCDLSAFCDTFGGSSFQKWSDEAKALPDVHSVFDLKDRR